MVSQVFWWAVAAGGALCVAVSLAVLVTGRPAWDDWPRPDATPAVVRLRVVFPLGVSVLLTLKALRHMLDPATAGVLDAGSTAAVALVGLGIAATLVDLVRGERGADDARDGRRDGDDERDGDEERDDERDDEREGQRAG